MSSKEGKNKFLIDEHSIDMRLDNYLLKRIKDVLSVTFVLGMKSHKYE